MDLFTAISIITLVLIVITPVMALAIGFTARKRIDNIIKLLNERIEERDSIIFGLRKYARQDGALISELTAALNEANKLIEKTIDDLHQSRSAYNLLEFQNENYVLTIKDLRAELENQS